MAIAAPMDRLGSRLEVPSESQNQMHPRAVTDWWAGLIRVLQGHLFLPTEVLRMRCGEQKRNGSRQMVS